MGVWCVLDIGRHACAFTRFGEVADVTALGCIYALSGHMKNVIEAAQIVADCLLSKDT